ncbi:hypothetical protein DYB32_004221 [Aphanomyces invadans]|uniref:Cyclic nucleotide-binding domain-containing protein n=1 Tax=Aphanomyces invadans TaxID=157072 RepID=A0A3R6VYB9_9STRA|nr:hypothetical protein DYB32_004221 [Aphanomyces invadans]
MAAPPPIHQYPPGGMYVSYAVHPQQVPYGSEYPHQYVYQIAPQQQQQQPPPHQQGGAVDPRTNLPPAPLQGYTQQQPMYHHHQLGPQHHPIYQQPGAMVPPPGSNGGSWVHRDLCAQVCAVRLTASTVLFQEDDDGGFVYFLLVGRINLFKHNLVKPDTSDGSRPTVETFLKSVPVENVHTEAALLDLDNLRQQTVDAEETPMYTLRAGAEFGHQGRFRHLARYCSKSRGTSGTHERSVVQVPGQAHEGLLVVRRGMCKLITHNSSMLGSRRPRGACLATKTGVKKSHQHNALHTYTTMEHEDSPMAFFHANQALTRHLLAVPSSLRLETVHKRLGARDFVGEESFLSNESNRRVHATHTFVTDSECELLYLRKADFFSDTSYYTRQRVRANIQRTAAEDPPSPTHPPNQQDRDEVKWEAYKQKLVHEVLHKRG